MKNKIIDTVLILILLLSSACTSKTTSSSDPIRIGWQTTWATQGQIVQALKHTDFLSQNGLAAEFVGVTYGAPLNEAALAGSVDVIFTADQPAATLISKDPNWLIIGRLMFNRVAIYVPPQSSIQTVSDLRGKTIAMPFGAAAQRVALQALIDAGVNAETEINAINMDITEQSGIVASGTMESWGEIDAMVGFDPTPAIFETKGVARMIYVGQVTSVIVMSKDYIQQHPSAPVNFLKAFKQAVYYYAQNIVQCNEWFRTDTNLDFSDDVLEIAASVEPNIRARSLESIDLNLTPELIVGLQEAADFILRMKLVDKSVKMSDFINLDYLEDANKELAN